MESSLRWQDFPCLHADLVASLVRHRLARPTRVQTELFAQYPLAHDFLIAAQTGSGKTLAFSAPILSELVFLRQQMELERLPQCILVLVLTPTRELAQQIHLNMTEALETLNSGRELQNQVTVGCIIGGISK